jgi:hypothetical protein
VEWQCILIKTLGRAVRTVAWETDGETAHDADGCWINTVSKHTVNRKKEGKRRGGKVT